MERDADIYLAKAAQRLLTAESDFDHGRYNRCANRCYYACFQAAIAAMLREGIRSSNDQWPHTFAQSVFVRQLVNRRHRYPSALRDTMGELQLPRQRTDYETDWITRAEANRGLRRCREFVATIQQTGGERR